MSATAATSTEAARFAALIAARLGFAVDDGRAHQALAACAALTRQPTAQFLDRLALPSDVAALHAAVTELTVGETYFFRHHEQLDAFADSVVPERIGARGPARELAVLSAGCSSGEEAYSLAILLHDRLRALLHAASWHVAIDAVDINPDVLARARRGVYSKWSLRQTAPDVLARWFVRDGDAFALDPTIMHAVRFAERNLATDDGWPTARYDAVFCRNVLMYFAPAQAAAALARLIRALVPGGYLFLGHAESLHGRSEVLARRHSHGTFYYQAAGGGVAPPPASALPALVSEPAVVQPAQPVGDWADAIRSSGDRVAALAEIGAALAAERYGEALTALDALPPAVATVPEALLLRAVALIQRGERFGAEAACGAVLASGAPPAYAAGAHYVLALDREGRGDRIGAVEHAGRALALDPQFAMASVQLGLIARRIGDRETASRELARAIELLAIDDPARIDLFGGGFGRDAWIELCRAELRAARGTA